MEASTAGNTYGINDGAASCSCNESLVKLKKLGIYLQPLFAQTQVQPSDPSIMGLGPVPATNKSVDEAGITIDDLNLIEANEAFAAQEL